jgi:hypothetical protein
VLVQQVKTRPAGLTEFADHLEYMEGLQADVDRLRESSVAVQRMYELLETDKVPQPPDVIWGLTGVWHRSASRRRTTCSVTSCKKALARSMWPRSRFVMPAL